MKPLRMSQQSTALLAAACFSSLLLTLLVAGPAVAEPPGWDLIKIAEPQDFPELALDAGRAVFGPQEGSSEGDISLYGLATDQLTTLVEGALGYGEGRQLDGDHLVYVRGAEAASEVYLSTVSTGESLRLTNNQVGDTSPRIVGDLVVWGEDTPQDFTTPLWLYRIGSGEKMLLESDKDFVYPLDLLLSGEWVVWRRFDRPDATTWAYSAATGEKRELPQLSGDPTQSRLEDLVVDVLYYVKRTASGYALHSLDLASGQDRVVWSGRDEFQSVRASDGRLAWASYDAGGSYVSLFDPQGDGPLETRIYSPAYTVGGLVFAGDLLIWRGDPRTTWLRVPTSYLFAYEIFAGRLTRLTSPQLYAGRWETDGEHVLYSMSPFAALRYPIVLALAVPVGGGFADISGTHPYRTAALGLQEAGVVGGYGRADGGVDFRPDALLNRAQFAKILAEGLDVPVSEDLVAPFSDLGPDRPDLYPHEYVAALASLGIVKGTSPQGFSPWAPVTRAQLVTLAVRAAHQLRESGLLVPGEWWMTYTLGNFDPTHAPAMSLAERNGLLDGLVGFRKSWDPWGAATRGEAAQVLWNLMTLRD
ncbi:MAG: S-layer homology domain-containing protein [Thermoleophilia bacterium]